MSAIVIFSPSFTTIFVNLYSKYDVFLITMSYSSGSKSILNVPSLLIIISCIIFLGSSLSSSFLVSLELYTIICALWLFWSLACVITLPVIADCLWIFTVYCFCIPLIDVTVIVISLVVTVLKSICLVLLPLVFSFPSTDTKANSCVAIAFKSTFVCVAFTFT